MSGHRTPLLFWDVDTQVDFMRPDGRLYVPGAEELAENLAALTRAAERHRIPVFATADDHEPDDEEISEEPDFAETFPPHCMRGTPGVERVPETRLRWTLEVGHRRLDEEAIARGLGAGPPRVLIHKKRFDVFTNVNTDRLLAALDPHRVVVYGVALDVCNRAAVEGLLARRVPRVTLVSDATRAIDPARGESLLAEWRERGVELTWTRELVAELDRPS